jgi:hypothetical protein
MLGAGGERRGNMPVCSSNDTRQLSDNHIPTRIKHRTHVWTSHKTSRPTAMTNNIASNQGGNVLSLDPRLHNPPHSRPTKKRKSRSEAAMQARSSLFKSPILKVKRHRPCSERKTRPPSPQHTHDAGGCSRLFAGGGAPITTISLKIV